MSYSMHLSRLNDVVVFLEPRMKIVPATGSARGNWSRQIFPEKSDAAQTKQSSARLNHRSSLLLSRSLQAKRKSVLTAPRTTHVAMTPRTTYSHQQEAKFQERHTAVLRLTQHDLETIKESFEERKSRSVNLPEFVQLIQDTLGEPQSPQIDASATFQTQVLDDEQQQQPITTEALCDVFKDIDVNSDGSMTWDEFTSHLVEVAHIQTQGTIVFDDQRDVYHPSGIRDASQHANWVEHVLYFPSLDRLVCFEKKSSVFKIYTTSFHLCKSARGHRAPLLAATHMPEHDLFVTSSQDMTLSFWSTRSGSYFTLLKQWDMSKPQLCLAQLAGTLYSSNTNNKIISWSVERGESKHVFSGHDDLVMALLPISPIHNTDPSPSQSQSAGGGGALALLVSGSLDCTVRIWDAIQGTEIVVLRSHKGGVLCLAYCAALDLLISGGLDPYVLTWKCMEHVQRGKEQEWFRSRGTHETLPKAKLPCTVSEGEKDVHVIQLGVVEGKTELVMANNRGSFLLVELRSGHVLQQWNLTGSFAPHTSKRAKLINFRPSLSSFTMVSGKRSSSKVPSRDSLSIIAACGTLHRYNRASPLSQDTDEPVVHAQFNPQSLTFLTTTPSSVRLWNALTGALMNEYDHVLKAAAYASHSGDGDGQPEDSAAVRVESSDDVITCACIDPRMRRFLVGTHRGFIQVFGFANGAPMRSLDRAPGEVSQLQFIGDPVSIISASEGRMTVHTDEMISVSSAVQEIRDHEAGLTAMGVSHNRHLVATGGSDGQVLVRRMEVGGSVIRCEGHRASITAMCFLEPHPLLLVGDASGVCAIYHTPMPHASNTFPRVSQWKNQVLGSAGGKQIRTHNLIPVTSVSFVHPMLCTGDESGRIRIFSLTDFIKAIPTSYMQRSTAPKARSLSTLLLQPRTSVLSGRRRSFLQPVGSRHRSALSLDQGHSFSSRRSSSVSSASSTYEESPAVVHCDVAFPSPMLVVHAHADTVKGLEILAVSQPALLSWGYDGKVHLWNYRDGTWLGSLVLSATEQAEKEEEEAQLSASASASGGMSSSTWLFFPDIGRHKKERQAEVRRIQMQVSRLRTSESTLALHQPSPSKASRSCSMSKSRSHPFLPVFRAPGANFSRSANHDIDQAPRQPLRHTATPSEGQARRQSLSDSFGEE